MIRRKRSKALAALAGDELAPEYYERAVKRLMQDESEQRDFVHSELLDLGMVRALIAGDLDPDDVLHVLRGHFDYWLREHRKFRVTTMAWALYAADHPTMRRK